MCILAGGIVCNTARKKSLFDYCALFDNLTRENAEIILIHYIFMTKERRIEYVETSKLVLDKNNPRFAELYS